MEQRPGERETADYADLWQAIQDCAAMGIKIQAYTKVPSFAKLVKDTVSRVLQG